jgi:tRNA-splicing ligase RtcB (3'-phosphate/5'-hydroxy nucleic acid ligase)
VSLPGGERGVLCADGHKGYAQPIGGVVAYKDKISLSGVGFDIACGNLAIRTDVTLPQIQWAIPKIMDDIVRDISFGIGRKAKMRVGHELFDDLAWNLQPMRGLKSLAADQLGTVGGGNHYVDLFVDEEDRILCLPPWSKTNRIWERITSKQCISPVAMLMPDAKS